MRFGELTGEVEVSLVVYKKTSASRLHELLGPCGLTRTMRKPLYPSIRGNRREIAGKRCRPIRSTNERKRKRRLVVPL